MKGINSSKLLQSCEEEQLRKIFSIRSESEYSIEDLQIERKSFEELCSLRSPSNDSNQIRIEDNFKIREKHSDEAKNGEPICTISGENQD